MGAQSIRSHRTVHGQDKGHEGSMNLAHLPTLPASAAVTGSLLPATSAPHQGIRLNTSFCHLACIIFLFENLLSFDQRTKQYPMIAYVTDHLTQVTNSQTTPGLAFVEEGRGRSRGK